MMEDLIIHHFRGFKKMYDFAKHFFLVILSSNHNEKRKPQYYQPTKNIHDYFVNVILMTCLFIQHIVG